jgi:hypothetical protein
LHMDASSDPAGDIGAVAGQVLHAGWPFWSWYLPATQSEQRPSLPAVAKKRRPAVAGPVNFPGGHWSATHALAAVAPVVGEVVPAGHASQAVCPVLSLKVFTMQVLHTGWPF